MAWVNIGNLDEEVVRLISQYGEELQEEIAKSLAEIGAETEDELKQLSPKDSGNYSQSWFTKLERKSGQTNVVVANKEYRLTHILEGGTSNSDGTKRTNPQPHVSTVNEHTQKKVIDLFGD